MLQILIQGMLLSGLYAIIAMGFTLIFSVGRVLNLAYGAYLLIGGYTLTGLITIGIGIAAGYATLGLVGYEDRYDYTANGNVVNLASRLCDHADDGDILLSPRAFTALEDRIEAESIGELDALSNAKLSLSMEFAPPLTFNLPGDRFLSRFR